MGTGIFFLHSFAAIPLPNQFRGMGFRFGLAAARSPDRCSHRLAGNPSTATAQPGAIVPEKWRGVRWQADFRAVRLSRLRRVTAAATIHARTPQPVRTAGKSHAEAA